MCLDLFDPIEREDFNRPGGKRRLITPHHHHHHAAGPTRLPGRRHTNAGLSHHVHELSVGEGSETCQSRGDGETKVHLGEVGR